MVDNFDNKSKINLAESYDNKAPKNMKWFK